METSLESRPNFFEQQKKKKKKRKRNTPALKVKFFGEGKGLSSLQRIFRGPMENANEEHVERIISMDLRWAGGW